jgi:hypothetical protein
MTVFLVYSGFLPVIASKGKDNVGMRVKSNEMHTVDSHVLPWKVDYKRCKKIQSA